MKSTYVVPKGSLKNNFKIQEFLEKKYESSQFLDVLTGKERIRALKEQKKRALENHRNRMANGRLVNYFLKMLKLTFNIIC